jgi:tetratricopeptide (TPR) repeat protein
LLGAAYLEQGRHEEAQERWQEAAACYDRATTFAPSDPNAYVGKANACVQLGQFRAAAGALEKLSALDPKNPTIYLSLGDVLAYDGRLDEARRQWEKARPLIAAGDSALRSAIDLRLSGGFNPGAAR